MTQFVLIKTEIHNGKLAKVSNGDEPSILKVAESKFSNCSPTEIYLIKSEGQDIDGLMVEAQKDVVEGKGFEETKLYSIIIELSKEADELVFWYGSESHDLDEIDNVDSLLISLEESISNSFCEAYLHYKKPT